MSIPAAVATLRAQSYTITTVAFHASNLRIVSGDDEGWCIQWSLVTRRPITVWKAHGAALLSVKWMSDELLLTHGRDNKLHLHRLDDRPLDTDIPRLGDNPEKWRKPWLIASLDVNALNFCSAATWGSNRIAVPGTLDSDTIDVYDLLPELKRPYKAISCEGVKTGIVMAIELMEDRLIAGYESGHLAIFRLWEDSVSSRIYLCKAHSQPVLSVALHPADSTFISSSADSKLAKHPLYPQYSNAIPMAASTANDDAVCESACLNIVDINHTGIASIDIRDDEKIFAVACWDGMVRVLLYKSLKLLASFKGGRQQGITCTKFGRTLLSDRSEVVSDEGSSLGATHIGQTALAGVPNRATLSSTVVAKQERKVQNKHWLAVGGKDGKIGLWEIY
ncbi:WD40 repeat-like protein [Lipomyces kononenkoae]|uniref:WD40 repeat-like protein n=1 Tax=Lipomyces kononenkoae TaxID=34357 RepID=A0ACC3STF6_LIPKO